MMGCADYRRSLLTDPARPSEEMRAHVAHCAGCAQYTDGVLSFDARLQRALQVDIGERPAGRSAGSWRSSRRANLRRRGLAVAASVLLAVCGGGFLWLAAPGRSLAAAVVQHMAEEPDAWTRTEIAVPESKLDAVMRESGVQLRPSAGLVSYVNSCEFRGHQVPHLVVQTGAGPVTVMVLAYEPVRRGVRFDEQGYRGRIVPVPDHGSLAVLERSTDTDADKQAVDAVAGRVLAALAWTH